MRVTSKGQVTIPKHVRDRAGIHPGTEVDIVMEDGKVVVVRQPPLRDGESRGQRMVREMQAAARRAKTIPLTTDEIMEMTRGPYDDLDPD